MKFVLLRAQNLRLRLRLSAHRLTSSALCAMKKPSVFFCMRVFSDGLMRISRRSLSVATSMATNHTLMRW